jgi:hypothetical protein
MASLTTPTRHSAASSPRPLCLRPDHLGQLGARWVISLARSLSCRRPFRTEQSPHRWPRCDADGRGRRADRLRTSDLANHRVIGISAITLSAGTALTLAGVETHTALLAGAGTVIAGVGFGASALPRSGRCRASPRPANAAGCSPSPSSSHTWPLSLPALAAGYASTSVGLHTTTVVLSLGVIALGIVALGTQVMRSGARVR